MIANDELGYGWQTYPERLQDAGVSWKIYQDAGVGLDKAGVWGFTSDPYIGNYGDNSLLYFFNYQNATPGSPLYQRARTGTDVSAGGGFFDVLKADVKRGKLPSVSWIVAPEAYTEHPAWPAGYGAWYTAGVLNALTSDPEVWSKTVLLITFDENDGFFDHVVAPYPNVGTLPGKSTVPLTDELFDGTAGTPGGTNGVVGPYGGGVRVPLLAVSPWSRGGWVCSETFDHTSLIRFIEARFGVDEPNITPWRRAVFGDLTGGVRLRERDGLGSRSFRASAPTSRAAPRARAITRCRRRTDRSRSRSRGSAPRAGSATGSTSGSAPTHSNLKLAVKNRGGLGVYLQARSLTVAGGPYTYTIGAGHELAIKLANPGTYGLSLYGPNGFFRHYAGSPRTSIKVQEIT